MAYRTICEILEEARKCNETRNYSHIEELIEEINDCFLRMVQSINAKKNRPNKS